MDRRIAGSAAAAAAAFLAALAACSGRQASPAPGNERPALAYSVLDVRDAALNAHDLDTAARAYAVNAEVIDAGTAAVVLRGREEIRAAHGRFLAACPRGRIEVLERSYQERGRLVTALERVRCDRSPPVEGWMRYQIEEGTIVRVLRQRSPLFDG